MKTLKFYSHILFISIATFFIASNALSGQESAKPAGNNNYKDVDRLFKNAKSKQEGEWLFYTRENTSLPYYEIIEVIADYYDNIWLSTRGGGLVKYDGAVWTVYDEDTTSWACDYKVTAMEVDNYGKLWVATIDGSLSKFDGINEEVLIPPN
ncbi:MAG: hypothetical protein ACQERS_10040, partial [Bacteroidota bacterium]